ncbi:MAG: hypothetical protein ACJ741_02540 [Pyrinomonadaceae bacterium]
MAAQESYRSGYVVPGGRPNAGKSTLLSQRIGEFFLSLILLLCFHAFSQAVAAQTTTRRAAASPIRLRVRGRRIVLTAGGRTQPLDLGEKVSAARLDGVKLLFVTRRADFNYLLLDAHGTSKLKGDMHECGAGEEFDLLWLKLTPAWRLVESRGARYESCWGSVTSEDGYQIEKNVLRLAYSDFKWKREVRLTYDADQPERGFVSEESEMKDNPTD